METTINFQSILIISVLAFFTPIVINSIKKVKIPFVVGEILVGLLFGKSALNLIHADIWIVFLSNLGMAYLFFLSGLEIDFGQFQFEKGQKSKTARNLFVCLLMLLISLLASYGVSAILVELHLLKNILFGMFLLSATAPGIIVPFLKERDLIRTEFGQMMLIFTLLCEFVCLISITILSSIIDTGLSYHSFLFMLVILVSYVIYWMMKRYTRRFSFQMENYKSLHIEVRAAFALIIIMVSLSHSVGAEIVMGSFLAGIIFSLVSGHNRESLKDKLDIIGYGFLIPIFFIQLGANIDVKSILDNPGKLAFIPLLLVTFYIVKMFGTMPLYFLFGKNKAISAGIVLSSQLSIMIVGIRIAYNLGVVSAANYTLFVVTTILSCFLFPMLFERVFQYEGIVRLQSSALHKICMRESTLTNEELVGKPLMDIAFPESCRIIMIVRGEDEILPNGTTVLHKGDILLMAGTKEKEDQMITLISK